MNTVFIKNMLKSFLILTLAFFTIHASAGERLALVIGNADYAQGYLHNPVNDAEDMANVLQNQLGFTVKLITNGSRSTMLRAVQQFRKDLNANTEVALFYYAGHGAQYQHQSYLLPLSAQIASADDLPIEALPANNVLEQMRGSGSPVNVMILDACRDLPFPALNRSINRGLSRMMISDSALVAYSTSPGRTAADGDGRNSPYTAALLHHLPKPNVTLTQLFNDIGLAVKHNTKGAQVPMVDSSPMPNIYLVRSSLQPSQTQPPAQPENTPRYNASRSPVSDPKVAYFLRLADSMKGRSFKTDPAFPDYCEQYGNIAAYQAQRRIYEGCTQYIPILPNDPASQWHRQAAPQADWCMTVSAYATEKETLYREEKLQACLAFKRSIY